MSDEPTVLSMILDELRAIRRLAEKTNGRVTALEKWKARVEGVQAAYRWVIPVVTSVIAGIGATGLTLVVQQGH